MSISKDIYVKEALELPNKCLEMIFDRLYSSEPGEGNPFNPFLVDEICGDTPIEKIFYTAFMILVYDEKLNVELIPQEEIELEGRCFRVDFLYDAWRSGLKSKTKLVIECDGYRYHHSSKQQVDRDYERDLILKRNGYEVIRLSGSQIYKDPRRCAFDVLTYIIDKDGTNYVF